MQLCLKNWEETSLCNFATVSKLLLCYFILIECSLASCILYRLKHTLCLITVACLNHQCPSGSECKVCNDTGLPYCEYSCAVDNGGCDEGRRCVEVDVPSCGADQCCSHVNITCQGKLLSKYLHAYIRTPTYLHS